MRSVKPTTTTSDIDDLLRSDLSLSEESDIEEETKPSSQSVEKSRQPTNMRSVKPTTTTPDSDNLLLNDLSLSEESDIEEETKPSSQSVEKCTNPPLIEPPSTRNPGLHKMSSPFLDSDTTLKVVSCKKKAQVKPEGCGQPWDEKPINNHIGKTAELKMNGKLTKNRTSNKRRPCTSFDEVKIPEEVHDDWKKKKGHRPTTSSLKTAATLPTTRDSLKNNDTSSTKKKKSSFSTKKKGIPTSAPTPVLQSSLSNNEQKGEKVIKPLRNQENNSDKLPSIKIKIDLSKIDHSKIRESEKPKEVRHCSDLSDTKQTVERENLQKRKRTSSSQSKSQTSTVSHRIKKLNEEYRKDKTQGHLKERVDEDSRSEQNVKPDNHKTDQPARPKTSPEETHAAATIKLLKEYHSYFESLFRNEELRLINKSWSSEHTKLSILSYRCQAMLCYKLFLAGEAELKEKHNIISEFISMQGLGGTLRQGANNTPHPADGPNQMDTNQGTPFISFIPLPAGSNGSVESESSGYSSSSSTDHACLNRLTAELPSPPEEHVNVPTDVFDAIERQSVHLQYLFYFQNIWGHADNLIFNGNRDFFKALDNHSKPLTPDSTLSELAEYIREGISRVKNESLLHSTIKDNSSKRDAKEAADYP